MLVKGEGPLGCSYNSPGGGVPSLLAKILLALFVVFLEVVGQTCHSPYCPQVCAMIIKQKEQVPNPKF